MFGRIFGRGKDVPGQAVCARCGRTLLAGEWTRRVTGPNGEERLLCSLCGPELPLDQDEPPEPTWTPAEDEDVHDASLDAGGQAAAEGQGSRVAAHDDAIAALQQRLELAEARNEELRRELERLRSQLSRAGESAAAAPASENTAKETCDSSEPGERTWGETPAEFAAAAAERAGEAKGGADEAELLSASPEDTQPLPAVEAGKVAAIADAEPAAARPSAEVTVPESVETLTPESVAGIEAEEPGEDVAVNPPEEPEVPAAVGASDGQDQRAGAVGETAEPVLANAEVDVAALGLLQRGVDLFNVSRVPRKIAETNEQLGLPSVHADLEDPLISLTFMWSMGWYRFVVDTNTGDVKLADRGYEEMTDLLANAAVRPDGTVQLAPAQISRAAAQRVQQEDHSASRADERQGDPEPPSVAAQKPPEILSKSLLGQRSDDRPAAWEKTQARDFDWDR